MTWLKRILVSSLVAVSAFALLAMLTLYLTPLDVYVPEVEKTLSARLQMPVSVGSLRVAVFPWPHLELRDTLLGGTSGIAVRSLNVSPVMPDLLAGRLVMHLELRDGAAHFAQIRKLLEVLSRTPAVKQGPRMGEMWLSGVIVLFPDVAVGPLEGKLDFSQAGVFQRAWFGLDEKKLTITLTPLPNVGVGLQVRAKNWNLPYPVRLPLDNFLLDGVFTGQGIVANQLSVTSRGMHIVGLGGLDFSEGWVLHGSLTEARIHLDQLMALLGKPVGLYGTLSGKGKLDAQAGDWKSLPDNLNFVGDLRADNVRARISESFAQPLAIDSVRSHVDLDSHSIELSRLEATLYGGTLSSNMRIQRDVAMFDAKVAVKDIDVARLGKALSNEVLLHGRLQSEVRISMSLDRLDRFPQNLKLAGKFKLRDGALSRIDLAQAVNSSGKSAVGVTRFDSLTGSVNINLSGYHFRDVRISSGSLNADGWVDVAPTLQLKGILDVDLKRTGGLVSMPMVISGTLNKPVVRVSGAAWAGAAVGTAILGPGLGTALGVKVGGFLNKLFGGRREKSNSGVAGPANTEGAK